MKILLQRKTLKIQKQNALKVSRTKKYLMSKTLLIVPKKSWQMNWAFPSLNSRF